MNDFIIVDDVLDIDLVEYIDTILIHHLPLYYNHTLSDGTNICVHNFEENVFPRDTYNDKVKFKNLIVDFILYKIQKNLKIKFETIRSYINFYLPNTHDSEYHIDDNREKYFTILFMVSKTPKINIGQFEYIHAEKNKVNTIDFKQNRLIIFNSNVPHRGLSFPNEPRITLTYKCRKLDEDSSSY